jgi:DNA-binding MarR family transcriptional regulator
MSLFLQDKPVRFIIALSNRRGSALAIGREIYSCNNSIYDTLDKFEEMGLVNVTKDNRNLKVKITPKGHQAIHSIFLLLDYK